MQVKMVLLEFDESDFAHIPLRETWQLPLGSGPRYAGEVVEGFKVPEGKVWLFPLGGKVELLRRVLNKPGVVITHNIVV